MKSEKVIYLGRAVQIEGFRAFVYSFDNEQKLVDSWSEYQSAIASGVWFSTKDSVPSKSQKAKKKGTDCADS